MTYEERVINGVLHYRNDLYQEWTAYTDKQLTALYCTLKNLYNTVTEESDNIYSELLQYLKSTG